MAPVVLSVVVRSGLFMTAVNGTLVERPVSTTTNQARVLAPARAMGNASPGEPEPRWQALRRRTRQPWGSKSILDK